METPTQVYKTRNTEYHVRQGRCVAVRDRASGQWLREHRALQQPLTCAVAVRPSGALVSCGTQPRVGQLLLFSARGRDLLTSPLLAIDFTG